LKMQVDRQVKEFKQILKLERIKKDFVWIFMCLLVN
jgi:hypothetical protein